MGWCNGELKYNKQIEKNFNWFNYTEDYIEKMAIILNYEGLPFALLLKKEVVIQSIETIIIK